MRRARWFCTILILLMGYMGGSGLLARRLPGSTNRPTPVVLRHSNPLPRAVVRLSGSKPRPRGSARIAVRDERPLLPPLALLGAPGLLGRAP
ncbi:MAG: hypothetical protein ACYCW6_03030 [Candidatus Xenobia bacterium]